MKRENILYSIIGVLLGFIVGFAFANAANQRGFAVQTAPAGQAAQTAALPPDHPPIDGAAGPGAEAIESASKLAAEQPGNFEAQVNAAQILYSAHRYDEAVKFFAAANRLRPEDFDALVGLGNANFDAEKFVEAERWYAAALKQRPDDVDVRTDLGLTFFFREPRDIGRAVKEYRASLERDPNHVATLQNITVALTAQGDADAARATLAKLKAVSPQNSAIPRLSADLEKLGARREESAAAPDKK
ncbi:MAG TPA: tetratricopeptide repeat protein [Pyrinomonadaceae bacterium]|jgi:tetratricopeptide (TPR) repeat protein|nr:tetratricopeptide repeat protein [Pyrinomonadaceae bacterium]